MKIRIFIPLIALLALPARAQSPAVSSETADCHTPSVCISKTYRSVVGSFAVMSSPSSNKSAAPDAVKALGVKIGFFFSDSLRAWRLSAMNKVCAGDVCIYYRKACNTHSCEYAYGNPGPWYAPGMVLVSRDHLVPGTMSITYATQEALQAAERNVFFALGSENNKTLVPFSELQTATDNSSPICEQNSKEPGCD